MRAQIPEEIEALLQTAGNFRPLAAVGLFAGLRLGEVLGLRWGDVGNGFLRIRRQLGRDRQPVDLKTAESKRDVVLVPQLARILREHRMASPYSAETDYVFPAPGGEAVAATTAPAHTARSSAPSNGRSSATGSAHTCFGTRSRACSSSASRWTPWPSVASSAIGIRPSPSTPTRTCSTRRATPTRSATRSRRGSGACWTGAVYQKLLPTPLIRPSRRPYGVELDGKRHERPV